MNSSGQIIENLVSTIIPVFNRPTMLRQAVDSVLAQTWRPIEIIITDDGSTDETRSVGRQFAIDHPEIIRYVWNENRGAGLARESGRQLARGEFIQYLDSDDTLWPRKFEIQIKALRDNPECGAAYGWIRLCPEGGTPVEAPHKWSGKGLTTLFPALLVDRWWNTNAPLWRRSVCDQIGPWSDLRYSQDWEYDARAGALGTRLIQCAEFVTDQRHHCDNRQTGSGRWLAGVDRVRFFSLLLQHAHAAGLGPHDPEMRHFVRWVLLNARQTAQSADGRSAQTLMGIAERANGKRSLDMRAFEIGARVLGWSRAARWAEQARALFVRGVGRHTRKQSWMH